MVYYKQNNMMINEILKKDKKIKWNLLISRHNEVPPLWVYLNIGSQYPKKWFYRITGVNFSFQNEKRIGNDWFWSQSDVNALKQLLRKEGNKDPLFFKRVVARLNQHCQSLEKWCFEYGKRKNYYQKSNKELLKYFISYWNKLNAVASFLLLKHVLNQTIEKQIKSELRIILKQNGYSANELRYHFEKILVPTKDTLVSQANRDLLAIAISGKGNKSILNHWLNRYNWIDAHYWWLDKPLTIKEAKTKIKKLLNNRRAEQSNPMQQFNQMKRDLHLRGSILTEIKALQNLLYLHTYELEVLFASKYWCQNLLSEVADRAGLSFGTYQYATYPEVIAALQGKKLNKNKLFIRKGNHFAVYRFKNDITILEGKDFERIINLQTEIKMPKKTTITGVPAFSGKVEGKVKIITRIQEFYKLKKGDILMTPMTTIDFVPLLPKVSAIITDEGGITCHAAIISRELKIPCIIGTKVATKTFKDGDLVEVNANLGIIKKIK